MRKILLYALLAGVTASSACKREVAIEPNRPETERRVLVIAETEHNVTMKDFALAVNEAVNVNPSFRRLVKEEALKLLDGDCDVLIRHIIDQPITYAETGIEGAPNRAQTANYTVRALLEDSYFGVAQKAVSATRAGEFRAAKMLSKGAISTVREAGAASILEQLTELYPDLQIAVPVHIYDLEDESYIPPVSFLAEEYDDAVHMYDSFDVPAFYKDSTIMIDGKIEPDSAVIVIGINKRGDLLTEPEVIPVPKNVTITTTPLGIKILWDKPDGATENNVKGYKVYRKGGNESNFKLIRTYSGLDNVNHFDGVDNETIISDDTYAYYVKAYWSDSSNKTGLEINLTKNIKESAASNIVSIEAPQVALPEPAYGFAVKQLDYNNLMIGWGATNNVGTYKLSKYIADDGEHMAQARFIESKTYSAAGSKIDVLPITPEMRNKRVVYLMEHISQYGLHSNGAIDYITIGDRGVNGRNEFSPVRIHGIRWNANWTGWMAGYPAFEIVVSTVDDAGNSRILSTWEIQTNWILWEYVYKPVAISLGDITNDNQRIYYFDEHIIDWTTSKWYSTLSFDITEVKSSTKVNVLAWFSKHLKPENIAATVANIASGNWLAFVPDLETIENSITTERKKGEALGQIYLDYCDPANGFSQKETLKGGVKIIFGTEYGNPRVFEAVDRYLKSLK